MTLRAGNGAVRDVGDRSGGGDRTFVAEPPAVLPKRRTAEKAHNLTRPPAAAKASRGWVGIAFIVLAAVGVVASFDKFIRSPWRTKAEADRNEQPFSLSGAWREIANVHQTSKDMPPPAPSTGRSLETTMPLSTGDGRVGDPTAGKSVGSPKDDLAPNGGRVVRIPDIAVRPDQAERARASEPPPIAPPASVPVADNATAIAPVAEQALSVRTAANAASAVPVAVPEVATQSNAVAIARPDVAAPAAVIAPPVAVAGFISTLDPSGARAMAWALDAASAVPEMQSTSFGDSWLTLLPFQLHPVATEQSAPITEPQKKPEPVVEKVVSRPAAVQASAPKPRPRPQAASAAPAEKSNSTSVDLHRRDAP